MKKSERYRKVRLASLKDHRRRVQSARETLDQLLDLRDDDLRDWINDPEAGLSVEEAAEAVGLTAGHVRAIVGKPYSAQRQMVLREQEPQPEGQTPP